MSGPIRRIRMREYATARFSVYLDAEVDDEGNLYVSAEHIGEAAGLEFEESVRVSRSDKETALRALVEEHPTDVAGALAWLEAGGLLRGPAPPETLGGLLETHPAYADTILLLLLKERFLTQADFRSWLHAAGIPSQFHSES